MHPFEGPGVPNEAMVTILAELRAGRKIAAIQRYRAATGAGLADSKDAVERIAVEHGLRPPASAASPPSLRLVLTLAVVAFVVIALCVVVFVISRIARSVP